MTYLYQVDKHWVDVTEGRPRLDVETQLLLKVPAEWDGANDPNDQLTHWPDLIVQGEGAGIEGGAVSWAQHLISGTHALKCITQWMRQHSYQMGHQQTSSGFNWRDKYSKMYILDIPVIVFLTSNDQNHFKLNHSDYVLYCSC